MIENGIGGEEEIRALLDAHSLILSLTLSQQSRDLAAGIPVSNRVELAGLGRRYLGRLKRAITRIEWLPHLLRALMAR
jgi:signal-transduction protein with cAMP-binding, CBS, and nucleotidyltransferase domain